MSRKYGRIGIYRCNFLFSLSLQAVLVLFAPLRKATGNKLIISVIWSAYLLADWAANFGVGLITERARDTPTAEYSSENNELLAFSLEDNELLLRHLFGLISRLLSLFISSSRRFRETSFFPNSTRVFCWND